MTPKILTSSVQSDFLSSEAQNASRLDLMVVRAENKTVDRYREVRPDGGFEIDLDGNPLEEDVQLDGWREDDNDDPDLTKMDEELVFALRDTISRIVEHEVQKPDEAEHVSRKVQGARQVDFRDKDLPSSVYAPLRRFSEIDAWH